MKRILLAGMLLLNYIDLVAQIVPVRTFHISSSVGATDISSEFIIVKFKSTSSKSVLSATSVPRDQQLLGSFGISEVKSMFPTKKSLSTTQQLTYSTEASTYSDNLSRIYQVKLERLAGDTRTDAQRLEQTINQLLANSAIEYAEPVYQYKSLASYTPNDPLIANQYYLKNIKAFEAWEVEKGSPDVTIGVVDWGFENANADLVNKIRYNTADPINGIDDDGDGLIDNYAGWDFSENDNNLTGHAHGTFVAGMAAAQADNKTGIAGLGFNCKFLPVKVQGDGGFKGYEGIVYAADRGCKVINISWGRRGGPSAYEQDIINYAAIDKDIVVVVAAGNDDNDGYYYPASYDHVISVAATNANDQKWSGSSYNDRVDISAPGQDMFSTSGYGFGQIGSGTSFGSPLVAGAAALVRSKYPYLSSEQVRNVLIQTSDNIDALNGKYVGGLGAGRLNVYRALTEGDVHYLKLVDKGIQKGGNQYYALPGETVSLWVQLQSKIVNMDNINIALTSSSSFVQIQKGSVNVGSISLSAIKDNRSNPFEVYILPTAPIDTLIEFKITYTDGIVMDSQSFTILVNPSYLPLQNNQISLAVTGDGRIGYESTIAQRYSTNNSSFTYKAQNLLSSAGFMLGVSADKVSNNVSYAQQRSADFSVVRALHPSSSTAQEVILSSSFRDDLNKASNIGVEVINRTYTWTDEKYAIVEYQIKNVSGGHIKKLQAGLFADWDVQGSGNNQADWDPKNRIGYVYNQQSNGLFAGTQLLTEQKPNYAALDNTTSSMINIFDGFSPAEKYKAMSSGVAATRSEMDATNVANVLAATIDDLQAGETRIVAFALLVGDNFVDLQSNAAKALTKFRELKKSPLPKATNQVVCKESPFVIAPTNGSRFRVYNSLTSTKPLAEGTMFQMPAVDKATTYYVSSLDSLYEGNRVALTIKPFTTAFDTDREIVDLDLAETVTLADHSEGAIKWRWDMGDGTIVRDRQTFSHTYIEAGDYTVQLITENAAGCEDIVNKVVTATKLEVTPTTTMFPEIDRFIRIYPNPTQGIVNIHVPADKELSDVRVFNMQGQEIQLPSSVLGANNTVEVNFEGQQAGLYQLQTKIGNKLVKRNIVVH